MLRTRLPQREHIGCVRRQLRRPDARRLRNHRLTRFVIASGLSRNTDNLDAADDAATECEHRAGRTDAQPLDTATEESKSEPRLRFLPGLGADGYEDVQGVIHA